MLKSKPLKQTKISDKIAKSRCRLALYQLVEKSAFEVFILVCILLNTIIMATEWYTEP